MSRTTMMLPAIVLGLVTLLGCNSRKSVVAKIQDKLPTGQGAGDAQCKASEVGADLWIACNPELFRGKESDAKMQIETLVISECEKIAKSGFLGIHVDFGSAGQMENSSVMLKNKSGDADCRLEAK